MGHHYHRRPPTTSSSLIHDPAHDPGPTMICAFTTDYRLSFPTGPEHALQAPPLQDRTIPSCDSDYIQVDPVSLPFTRPDADIDASFPSTYKIQPKNRKPLRHSIHTLTPGPFRLRPTHRGGGEGGWPVLEVSNHSQRSGRLRIGVKRLQKSLPRNLHQKNSTQRHPQLARPRQPDLSGGPASAPGNAGLRGIHHVYWPPANHRPCFSTATHEVFLIMSLSFFRPKIESHSASNIFGTLSLVVSNIFLFFFKKKTHQLNATSTHVSLGSTPNVHPDTFTT